MSDQPSINPTAAALLGLLAMAPMSGYELHGAAQSVFGDFWTVTRSQIYRELARLEQDGHVAAGEPGARARRPYSLTKAGRHAFADWVAREPGPETIRFPLLLTMTFGPWVGRDRMLEFVAAQRPAHEQRLARYDEALAADREDVPAFAAATTAFGRHYERAVLAWMDELPDLLAAAPAEPTDTP